MNKDQAIAFINAVNAIQPYVSPIMFGALQTSALTQIAVSVANGVATCEVKPIQPQAPERPALAVDNTKDGQ